MVMLLVEKTRRLRPRGRKAARALGRIISALARERAGEAKERLDINLYPVVEVEMMAEVEVEIKADAGERRRRGRQLWRGSDGGDGGVEEEEEEE